MSKSTVRIEMTLHRQVTEAQAEAAMYAAVAAIYDGDEGDERDDWGFDVAEEEANE